LLRANGCEALAVDLDAGRLALAERFGAHTVNLRIADCGLRIADCGPTRSLGSDPVAAAMAWSGGAGADGVIVTASAKNDAIMHQAAECCRKRGRIVLVGVVGLNLRRDDFYKKELSFQVSCSYGPGRYDEKYEQAGQDYPIGYVRWTEQRNFEAVLGAMASGALRVGEIVTHRFPFADALKAYECVQKDRAALGVVLEYPPEADLAQTVAVAPSVRQTKTPAAGGHVVAGVIGAGGFARGVLLPALAKAGTRLAWVADLNGAAAQHAAGKFGVEQATTDYRRILDDPAVQAVFVLVGHHLHARFVCEALAAGKHVFVEKPLAMNEEELGRVAAAAAAAPGLQLMLGFNRRFSAHTVKMCALLAGRAEPLCMSMTVNGGAIPADHWTQDPERGGGRIVGEGCHFMDLLAHLAGNRIEAVSALMVGEGPAVRDDKTAILLRFADGSVGTVNYFSNGSKAYPKEMLEVFSDGRVLRMENFRRTLGYGFKGFKKIKTFRQDKGHAAEVAAFLDRVARGGEPLIAFDELANITRASFAAVESARLGGTLLRVGARGERRVAVDAPPRTRLRCGEPACRTGRDTESQP
jgi:predicted dehydrogenase